MGSSCYGEPNLESETSNKSRKAGRKSTTNSDKPKQPRRGLGVAQLEKIRLHNQMGYNYLPPPPLHNHLSQEYMMIRQTPYSSSSSFVDSPPSSSSYGFSGNPSFDQMGLSYSERENIGYADVQPDITPRWPHGNVFQEAQQFTQPIITRQLFQQEIEEGSLERRRPKVRSGLMGSTSPDSESNGNQDLDLDLRLSL